MEIDKFIAELTKLRQTYGAGLKVMQLTPGNRSLTAASLPRVGHSKKEAPRVLFSIANDFDRDKGERIVVLGIGDNRAREERKAVARKGQA